MKNRKSTNSFASYRLFKLIKFLSENAVSVKDIVCYLETIDPENRTYSVITAYKYLNTIKTLGINLQKNDKNEYTLEKIPFTINFSKNSCLALKYFDEYSDYIEEDKLKLNLKSVMKKINKILDTETAEYYDSLKIDNIVLPRTYTQDELKLINIFEQSLKNELKICISYRVSKNLLKRYIVEPIEIEYSDRNVFFVVYDNTKGQNIFLEIKKIMNIEQLPQKAFGKFITTTAMYEIKGRLKKRYRLKKYESLYSSTDNTAVIINKGEDKDKFIRRLIGYCDLCEIVSPKTYKADMLAELDAMIKNYD